MRHREGVAIGFGDAELRATFDALQSSIETLRHAVENDDFEAVFTTLNDGKEIIDSHYDGVGINVNCSRAPRTSTPISSRTSLH